MSNASQQNTDGDSQGDACDSDDDNDGIPDTDEGTGDADGDGTPDSNDTDADNDGITDTNEGTNDRDNDGVPDFKDVDADGDGMADANEGSGDKDNDGVRDSLDTDSDNDGVPDIVEGSGDADGDGIPNFRDTDSDGDGAPDSIEFQQTGNFVAPTGRDTDADGVDDAYDPDNGGSTINAVDTDTDGTPDYLDPDADGDGILDVVEAFDWNFDGVPDVTAVGADSDGDGLDDAFETVTTPSQVNARWRDRLNGAGSCMVNSIRPLTKKVTKVSNAVRSRAHKFAGRAKTCGSSTLKAQLTRADKLHRSIVAVLSTQYTDSLTVCPANVCSVRSHLSNKRALLSRAKTAATLSRQMKLRAIAECGSGPDDGTPDNRKNSQDYQRELLAAINALPSEYTTCP